MITPSAPIAERIRALRNHGGKHKYEHLEVGTNSRLDSLQAVVLSAKLELLDEWNAERGRLAARYTRLLADLPQVVTPNTAEGNDHVFHQYVVQVADRDRVLSELQAQRIGAGLHYPTPVHLLPAFASRANPAGSFPVAERLAARILSLPIYPGLTDHQQDVVVECLRTSVRSSRGAAAQSTISTRA